MTNRLIVLYNTQTMGLKKLLIIIPIALSVGAIPVQAGYVSLPTLPAFAKPAVQRDLLAARTMSLTNRYAVPSVNKVFADNILLTLSYMSQRVSDPSNINWEEVRKPQTHEIVLQPGEVFAFHDGIMAKYAANVVRTTKAHFNAEDGFRSSGYLYGDGVCHLASQFNWVARDAGLEVVAPVNHDFAQIPEIPREYGTAIYYDPNAPGISEQQNLYIKNTLDKTVTFIITSQMDKVDIRVEINK